MNDRQLIIVLSLFTLLTVGCGTGDDGEEIEQWGWGASTEFGRRPRWSPDGAQILFGDDVPGRAGLWLWSLGEDPTRLAESLPPHNWDFDWSPDGDRIAFTSPGEPGAPNSGVWIVDVPGDTVTRALDRGRDVSWFSDREAVAIRIDHPAEGAPGIYRLHLNSGELTYVVDGYRPVCSPQGDRLAYGDGEIEGQLMVQSLGGQAQYATEPGAVQWEWSADGRALCCVVNHYISGTLRGDLWRITFDGDILRSDSLTSWAGYPAPDAAGGQVAFLRMSRGCWVGLWLHRDGPEELRIADYGLNPHFDPTGDRIAVNTPDGGIRILSRVE